MSWNIKMRGSIFIAILFVVVTLTMIAYIFGTTENYSDVFSSVEGELELTSHDLNYIIPLRGEWKYYESELILPGRSDQYTTEVVQVPHIWKGPGHGTYQILLKGLIPGEEYGFYAYDNSSAYKLFADTMLISENGQVGTSIDSEVHHWNPQLSSFIATNDDALITVMVSNYHSYPGGIYRDIKFGRFDNLIEYRESQIIHQVLLLGAILIMALYNLSMHLMNRKEHSAMFFGLFNLIVALRIALTGERLINGWLSHPDWNILLKIQFTTGAFMLVSFAYFMSSLFPERIPVKVTRFVFMFGVLVTMPVYFLPIAGLAMADTIFLGGSLLYFTYLLYTLVKAIRQNVEGSIFSFIGIMFITGSIILDAILPSGTNVIPLGIFIFVIFQSLVIAEKYSFLVEENLKLHNIATRDGMTNLFKKDHFMKQAASILANSEFVQQQHGMMFIDIDNFKYINDSYGHDIGDEVIKSLAEKLLRSLRYSDIAGRFGGDEFIVMLPNARTEDAQTIASRVLKNISEPMAIDSNDIRISASIGISFYPHDGRSVESLVTACDKRMYQAKSMGKNRYYIGDQPNTIED